MIRTQYITIEELSEILGTNAYTNDDLIHLFEASEYIEYLLFNGMKWEINEVPKDIKLATAYQFKYMQDNDLFDDFNTTGFTLGKFTMQSGANEQSKVSNKALEYLVKSGYMNRRV